MTLSTLADPPLPKRVKSGHLLSDYRQKRVNASRDILMSKARKSALKNDHFDHYNVLGKYLYSESDLGFSNKGYTGYRESLGGKNGIGGPNQANLEA